MEHLRINGPPGTGKTQMLIDICNMYLRGENAQAGEIIFCSFTKAAANEARQRAIAVFGGSKADYPWFSTEHSICFRLLGLKKEQVFTKRHLVEFGKRYRYDFSGNDYEGDSLESRYQEAMLQTLADHLEFFVGYMENRMLPFDDAYRKFVKDNVIPDGFTKTALEHYIERRTRYKLEQKLWSFSDMITGALQQGLFPEGVRVIIVDECFPYNTSIRLADGIVMPIGEIVEKKLAVWVKSFNTNTGEIENKMVTGWYKVPLRQPLMKVNNLICTANHPIYTKEFGYVKAGMLKKLYIDLRTLHILKYKHEGLPPEGINCNTKEPYLWEPIRRCEYISPSRQEWQFAGQVSSWYKTVGLSNLEMRDIERLGFDSTSRFRGDILSGQGVQISDDKSSSLYCHLQRALPRWYQKDNLNIFGKVRRPEFSSLVPRRWLFGEGCNYNSYPILYPRGLPNFESVAFISRDRESHSPSQGFRYPHYEKGSTSEIIKDSKTLYSALPEIQINWQGEAEGCIYPYGCSSITPLQDLWPSLCAIQIQSSVFPRVLQVTYESDSPGIFQSEGISYIRRHLHNLPATLCGYQQKAPICNLFPKLPGQVGLEDSTKTSTQNGAEEECQGYVYCLDVDTNRNFFANDILVHNCQDCSPHLWELIRFWSTKVEDYYIAGDPLQTLYFWAGSDPQLFFDFPGEEQVLNETHRFGKEIKDYAERIVAPTGLPLLKYEPAKKVGSVSRKPFLSVDWRGVGDSFLLVRTRWLISQVVDYFISMGIPFVSERGKQSPLATGKGRAFHTLLKFKDNEGVSESELRNLVKYTSMPFLERGTKTRIRKLVEGMYRKPDLPQMGFTTKFMEALYGDFSDILCQSVEDWEKSYLGRIWRKIGREAFERETNLVITTYHGSKGRQASNIYLMPDYTNTVWESYIKNNLPERLLMYVGATRAMNNLTILLPQKDFSFPFPRIDTSL